MTLRRRWRTYVVAPVVLMLVVVTVYRSHDVFADDVLRGSHVLSQKLPWHQDGWQQRRRAVRNPVV